MAFNKVNNAMTGTEGGPYTTVFVGAAGAIGFRQLHGEAVRVRVEVFKPGLKFPTGWKTPDGVQQRFSLVVGSHEEAVSAVLTARAIVNAYKPSLQELIAEALNA